MTASINITNDETIKRIGNNLLEVPKIFFSTNFISSSDGLELRSKKIPLFLQIANVSLFTEDGYISSNNDDYSPFELNLFRNYQMEQTIKAHLHIDPIFKKITEMGVLNVENLNNLFMEKGILLDNVNLNILNHGINTYIKKDFISSLHILIPQFENLFLFIAESSGIQTTAIERGKTVTKKITLSDTSLKSNQMIDVFGKDFCLYLRYLLYSPLGLSIRHKIAHGTIADNECSETNSNLVLIAIFILLNKIEKVEIKK